MNITHKKNLSILADEVDRGDYELDMARYLTSTSGGSVPATEKSSEEITALLRQCGTACCAMGLAMSMPAFGKTDEEAPYKFSLRVFGVHNYAPLWYFLFAAGWDSGKRHTANRLRYVAKHGREPDGWEPSNDCIHGLYGRYA